MKLLTIGQLAKASKVKMTTIRYYERCGLLEADSRTKTDIVNIMKMLSQNYVSLKTHSI